MDVPTRDEFDALKRRVADTEAALVALASKVSAPPAPPPPAAVPALRWVTPTPGFSAGSSLDAMVAYTGWHPLNVEVFAGTRMVGRLTDDPGVGAFFGTLDLSGLGGSVALQATGWDAMAGQGTPATLAISTDPVTVSMKLPATPKPTPTDSTDAPAEITSPLGHPLKLGFHDEFDGVPAPDLGLDRYIDETKWMPTFWQGSGERTLKDNLEAQYYMDARYGGAGNIPVAERPNPFVFAQPSVLSIEAFKVPPEQWANYWMDKTRCFASGLLCSSGRYSYRFGYWETRVKLPANKGSWPAAWLLPDSHAWPPEVDKFEAFGHRITKHSSGIIVPKGEKLPGTNDDAGWFQMHDPALPSGAPLSDDFHRFGLDWTPTEMAFVLDGNIWARRPTPTSFIEGGLFYLLLNMAVGGKWYMQANEGNAPNAWTVDEASMPWRLDLDYTRVWV